MDVIEGEQRQDAAHRQELEPMRMDRACVGSHCFQSSRCGCPVREAGTLWVRAKHTPGPGTGGGSKGGWSSFLPGCYLSHRDKQAD